MKLNKKGFTLVELLAVIVVLAIIALIGYTVVGDVITTSQTKADKISVENFAKALSNTVLMDKVDATKGLSTTDIASASTKDSDAINALKLDGTTAANIYSGDKVTCTSISVTDAGVVTLAGCYAGNRSDNTYKYENNTVTAE